MSIAPLADCTMGMIQEANKANNAVGSDLKKGVIKKMHTHNPYSRVILKPVTTCDPPSEKKRHEPNPNAPAFIPAEVPWDAYPPYAYTDLLYGDESAYAYNAYGSAYYHAQSMAPFYATSPQASYPPVQETTASADTSSVVDKAVNLSNSNASCGNTGTSVVSTPLRRSNNIYKMYVDGRPKVVRGIMYAEVKVELRFGSEVFVVDDVPHVFGVILKAEGLVDRYVIVEGDRGEDMGRVVSVERCEQLPAARGEEEKEAPDEKRLLRVLREALPEEVEMFHSLDQMEEEALDFCRAAIQSLKMRTPLQVQRAIFQFDRKKLTFTYCSDSYVEFKSLLRALNRQYQCRIWMHQLNWEANGRQRRHSSVLHNHRKITGESSRRRGGAKKDKKRSTEFNE